MSNVVIFLSNGQIVTGNVYILSLSDIRFIADIPTGKIVVENQANVFIQIIE